MVVVADASPIIGLHAVGRLQLLRDLYGVVVIPEAVRAEIARGDAGVALLAEESWIEVKALEKPETLATLPSRSLGRGEREAIALALELHADILVMDDHRARTEARKLGLPVMGVVGVLLEAKRRGRLSALRPVLEDLRDRADFRLSVTLIGQALRDAGED